MDDLHDRLDHISTGETIHEVPESAHSRQYGPEVVLHAGCIRNHCNAGSQVLQCVKHGLQVARSSINELDLLIHHGRSSFERRDPLVEGTFPVRRGSNRVADWMARAADLKIASAM